MERPIHQTRGLLPKEGFPWRKTMPSTGMYGSRRKLTRSSADERISNQPKVFCSFPLPGGGVDMRRPDGRPIPVGGAAAGAPQGRGPGGTPRAPFIAATQTFRREFHLTSSGAGVTIVLAVEGVKGETGGEMVFAIPLKKKYRTHTGLNRHAYRPRTGPMCCNSGCVGRKKRARKRASSRK